MQIRSPYETLAGCYHLARFTDKIRLHIAGELPPSYKRAFCSRLGVDGQFLKHFGLKKGEIIEAVAASEGEDARVEEWFNRRIRNNVEVKESWNDLAENLGKQGYPMSWIFALSKRTIYKGCKDPAIDTCFKVMDWDEGSV